MKIKVTTKNDVHIIKIEGPIKAGNEFELGQKIEEYISKGDVPKFIIDLKSSFYQLRRFRYVFEYIQTYRRFKRKNGFYELKFRYRKLNGDYETCQHL